jgi:8-oxo-dGTP pyrophosphatase MutT (NUDIX family)
MTFSLDAWLDAGRSQPDLPSGLPAWIDPLVSASRDATRVLTDPSRHVPRRGADGRPPRPSAVLMLMAGDATGDTGSPSVLLTHRNPALRSHSGQIAFPGGHREPEDPSPVSTALREATEETGLRPEGVDPLAVLEPLYIDRTNHAVVPVLGWWRAPSPISPSTDENDWVRSVPVDRLADPAVRTRVGFGGWQGPAFDVDGYLLWGFTGGLVDAVLRLGGWERPWDDRGEPENLFEALARSRNGETMTPADMSGIGRGDTP